MYMKPPNIMKRSVGEYRASFMRPHIVPAMFTENAATGTIIIMLCTMESVISHSGTGPPTRW